MQISLDLQGQLRKEGRDNGFNAEGNVLQRLDFIHYSASRSNGNGKGTELTYVPVLPPQIVDFRASRRVALDFNRVDRRLFTIYDTEPRASDEFRKLAISVITAELRRSFKRLLIASPEHGDGRTCVLLNLACALARAGKRVLVIDTDFLRPSVQRLLGIEADLGLAEVMCQGLPPEFATMTVDPVGFGVLPARGPIEFAAQFLTSDRLKHMFGRMEHAFDFILFDSSPLLGAAEANLLIPLCDQVLMVLRPGVTAVSQVAKAVSRLNKDDLLGVVLNRT